MSNKKLHNPKSNSPAVYIPCWLLQVPETSLSVGAKMLYGRLSQWSNEHGKVFRSVPQLKEELGQVSARTIERRLKELKDNMLIGTFHPQAGGVNHFEFYDHPWMYESINKHLAYKIPPPVTTLNPPSDVTVPPVRCGGTPPSDVADINKKEIKINTTTTRAQNLTKNPDPEPVVVLTDSLTSTPTPNPQTHVNCKDDQLTIKLLAIYRSKPFVTSVILCEEDFIASGLWGIEHRGEHTINQRLGGIASLVKKGDYEGEPEWISYMVNKRNSKIGDAKKEEIEKISASKVTILTTAKGREANLKEIMAKAMLDKKATTTEPVYPFSTFEKNSALVNKHFKKILPPKEQDDIMFQPDYSLLDAANNDNELEEVQS